ncbi:MAG TPA: hypothetical protein VEC14_16995, partial [Reyranellaceae bacterium]|nr:hypothetical protein [Reyranellaceae bacterium]
MKSFRWLAALSAALLLPACDAGQKPEAAEAERQVAPVLATEDAVDPHSFARPHEARVSHVALDLTVDFAGRRLGGTATLDIDRKPDA